MSKILLWYACRLDRNIRKYEENRQKFIIAWNNTSKKKYYNMVQKIQDWIDRDEERLDEYVERLSPKEKLKYKFKMNYITYADYLTTKLFLEVKE